MQRSITLNSMAYFNKKIWQHRVTIQEKDRSTNVAILKIKTSHSIPSKTDTQESREQEMAYGFTGRDKIGESYPF